MGGPHGEAPGSGISTPRPLSAPRPGGGALLVPLRSSRRNPSRIDAGSSGPLPPCDGYPEAPVATA